MPLAMHDVLIIGGGVIGLSLAWELARRGKSVHVIDQSEPGREASWAGAGILPPAGRRAGQHPYEQLAALAAELHPQWAAELREATGIDNGYRRCGGLYLAQSPGEAAALAAWTENLREEGVEVEPITTERLLEVEPGLGEAGRGELFREAAQDCTYPGSSTQYPVLSTQYSVLGNRSAARVAASGFLLPTESQIRNPRHLAALQAACRQAGVAITSHSAAGDVAIAGSEIVEVNTPAGPLRARQYCFTAGAWTGPLLARLGIATGIVPIRGQMVLFRCAAPPVKHIINVGSRYLVPRDDGRLLAGSTEEEAGFDKRTTDEAIAELTAFTRSIIPALREAEIERTWAGLRPGSFDGLPYLGRLPSLANAFVASGHFRSGLFLSPATAVVMAQALCGEATLVDLSPFRVGR